MSKKISQLDSSSPLQGTELLPVVQSSETRKSQICDVTNYLVPKSLTVSDGQSIDLNASEYDLSKLIRLHWSGESGIMTLTLPDATQAKNLNRVMRFISNGGFDTNTRVHLQPKVGQTLDGASTFYEINKEYEGIMVWSDGAEWFIIQRKA